MVVMCVSLMRHVEHLFTCLFAIRMSSLARCPFKPLPVFFIGLLECLLLNFESSVSKSLIGDVTCKQFLPVYGLSFRSLKNIFCKANF